MRSARCPWLSEQAVLGPTTCVPTRGKPANCLGWWATVAGDNGGQLACHVSWDGGAVGWDGAVLENTAMPSKASVSGCPLCLSLSLWNKGDTWISVQNLSRVSLHPHDHNQPSCWPHLPAHFAIFVIPMCSSSLRVTRLVGPLLSYGRLHNRSSCAFLGFPWPPTTFDACHASLQIGNLWASHYITS